MPIFEYRCQGCGGDFEKLLFTPRASVPCPHCGSTDVVKRPSTFGMSGVDKQVRSRDACSGCTSGSCSSCGAA
jgi:putative FmdB family regulatory protein